MSSNETVIKREQCPECLDSGQDNLAVYEDGHTHCFGCGYHGGVATKSSKKKTADNLRQRPIITSLSIKALPRGISADTCKYLNYSIGQYTGYIGTGKEKRYCDNETVHVANYCNSFGEILSQKIRTHDKLFTQLGDAKQKMLFGQWLWTPNEKLFVTVVEGEIDALTLIEVQGKQFPVVSVTNGAAGAYKDIEANLKWLMGWKYVVLAFDNDEPGRKAAEQCAGLFDPGLVRIATWPEKDANDLLMQGRSREIVSTIFAARVVKPENIVTISDILPDILTPPKFGIPFPWKTLSEITFGLLSGQIYVIVGATGTGKTEMVKDMMFHFLDQDINIGIVSFEQNPKDTVQRIISSKLGVPIYEPGSTWNEDEIKKEALKLDQKLWLLNKAGSSSMEEIFIKMRYEAKTKGVRLCIIDNLKGLKLLEKERAIDFMTKLQTLTRELGITVILLSHVAKDKIGRQAYVTTSPKNPEYVNLTSDEIQDLIMKPGMEWSTGRMPTDENIEGHGVIADLADHVLCIARNKMSKDAYEKRIIKVKISKTRGKRDSTGRIFKLYYTDEGKLIEEENGTNYQAIMNISTDEGYL